MYDNTTGLLQAYVNGTRTFSNTVTGRAYNGSAYYLSLATGDTTTIGGITSYYNGLVGVNRWYNTVLTPSQIVDNYNFEKAGFGL
jgi:hypothetical protein